jgi:hypothetical protein
MINTLQIYDRFTQMVLDSLIVILIDKLQPM